MTKKQEFKPEKALVLKTLYEYTAPSYRQPALPEDVDLALLKTSKDQAFKTLMKSPAANKYNTLKKQVSVLEAKIKRKQEQRAKEAMKIVNAIRLHGVTPANVKRAHALLKKYDAI